MNVQKLFAIEFFISIGISSWGAIKQGYMPWPPNIVGAAVAMGILSLTEAISPELSVLLGAGFILALIVATAGDNGTSIAQTFAALPQNVGYDVLKIGSNTASTANQGDTGQ